MIVDDGFYVGSAIMSWTALSETKEMGIIVSNCALMARNAGKIFSTYWLMYDWEAVPEIWPLALKTQLNSGHPAYLHMNYTNVAMFVSSSPDRLNPPLRSATLTAVRLAIRNAQSSISISLGQYMPAYVYSSNKQYWTILDTELRTAAYSNNVTIRLLVGYQNSTQRPIELAFLQSLHALPSIDVRLFELPEAENATHVSHSRYMVTDQSVFIGTSDWTADYFDSRSGVGVSLLESGAAVQEMLRLFDRDWESVYAKPFPPCYVQ
eukprot:TRINITY_DN3898_c0_g1_i3.p1 TRINITY_DN3898_c0_g1~~TRINITY_DN3898_c0_g1_i3.p1  ORF type:complete len:265 (+),score=51.87 TRINITY_DN3898_c0_g1_i3:764-1558(+)